MAVRRRYISSGFLFTCLALCLAWSSPAFADRDCNAQVYHRGQRLQFNDVPEAASLVNSTVYLNLRFDGVQMFNASALRLAVNGEIAQVSNWKDHSTWQNDHGTPVLTVRLTDATFWDHRTFVERLARIQRRHGHLRIWVQAPASVRSASLSFTALPPNPPRVVIDGQTPPESIFTSSQVTFKFHADGAADRTECALDGASFSTCASPLVYASLREGLHQFRVRAVAAGKAGAVNTVWFTVVPTAVTITAVDPKENPTSRSDIKVSFRVLSDILGTVSAQCQIDDGGYRACTSPVSYRGLSQGDHRFDVMRVTRFFFLSWTWYPTSYFWRIQTQAQPPVVQWTATPPAATKSASASFAFAADQAGTSFQCVVDNGAVQACTSPFNLTGLSEGAHRVQVTALGQTGLASAPIAYSWVTDYTAPVLTAQVSPAQAVTNATSLNVSYTVNEPGTVVCLVDGQARPNCVSPLALTGLAEGNHTVTLQATDAVGNVGALWSYAWTVDLTAPTLSLQMTSPASLPTNLNSAQFTLSATEAASILCTLDEEAPFACGAQVALSDLSEGSHTLTAVATDHAGNAGEPASVTWVIDLTAPTVTVGAVEPSENPTAHTDIQIAFSTSEAAAVQCNRDHSGYLPCTSPFIANGLADGDHVVEFIATDLAGNVSSAASYGWTVSSTASATLDNVVPGSSPTNSNTIQFTFSSAQTNQFLCALDSGAPVSCSSPQSYAALSEGDHHFAVQALNALGAPGPAAVYDWTVDRTAPVLSVTYAPAQSPSALNTIRADFSLNEAGGVTCQLDNAAAAPCVSPFTAANLVDGPHILNLIATDIAGNATTKSYSWNVITVANVALGAVAPAGSLVNKNTISIAFTSPNSSQFDCSLDGSAPATCVSPFTATVSDGPHHFAVRALNPAGAPGNAATYDWTSDTTAPVLSLGAANPSQNPTASTTMQLAFSVNEHAAVTYALDGAAAVAATSPVSLSGLADGAHSLVLIPTDDAGNVGAAQTYQWQVQTVATVSLGAVTPAGATVASHSISIAFSSTNSSQFQCALDGAAATSCASPFTATVADGAHSFAVRALNPSGQPGPAATYAWAVDTTAPVMSLNATPSQNPTASTSLSLAFSANEPATFDCSLDGAAAAACTSPFQASGLADGDHAIVVSATDSVGNRSVATYSWSILSVATVTLGTPNPSAPVTSNRSIAIPFSSTNSNQFVCSLDGAAPSACQSPASYSGLADGAHSFAVSALNPASQPGPAANYAWTVDGTAPTVSITSQSPSWSPTAATSLQISFSAEAGASFTCAVDGGSPVACTSPWTTPTLAPGAHSVSVIATDGVGNSSAPATYAWTIDTSALTVSNPSVDAANQTSTVVRWNTNIGANSQVLYGVGATGTDYPNATAIDPNFVTTHAVSLTGLTPNTLYRVKGRSVDHDGRVIETPVMTFRTPR